MDYTELKFSKSRLTSIENELLPVWLEPLNPEGFFEDEEIQCAYVKTDRFNRNALHTILQNKGIATDICKENTVPDQNWNKLWESNFEPVIIDELCFVGAPFHTWTKTYPYEIIIEPKMSFGTGHHATTTLMIRAMLQINMKNMTVLDAGCGTGILSILAEKLGADRITAVDNDRWSYNNTIENITVNDCKNIEAIMGDITQFSKGEYNLILANINLNIITTIAGTLNDLLKPCGILLVSGILESDIDCLKGESEKYALQYTSSDVLYGWAMMRLSKPVF